MKNSEFPKLKKTLAFILTFAMLLSADFISPHSSPTAGPGVGGGDTCACTCGGAGGGGGGLFF